jgi:DNA-binding transcriptional MerR regulator
LEQGPGFTVTRVATPTTSKAAADAGVNPDTLRYLRAGRPAGTTGAVGSGYRMYDGSTTDRVGLIKGAQGLGLRLDSIRERLGAATRLPASAVQGTLTAL